MKLKIAVVQFAIASFAPEENLKKAEHFIEEAAPEADLIVFPEDFVTGPLSGDQRFADYEGRYIRHFQRLAVQYAIDIVPGSIIEGDDSGLYNTTYYIDKCGEIKGKYRKVNLWHPERPYLTPGKEIPVFTTRFGRVGLMICWDLIFPEVCRSMVESMEEHLIGRSQVTVPFKGALTLLQHTKEAMFIQEVDLAILADAESAYKIRKDLQVGAPLYRV